MIAYIVRRLASLIPVLLGISLLAFAVGAMAPGDPVVSIYQQLYDQPPPNQEAVDTLRAELGLDAPVVVRYVRWLISAVQGDLGESYRTGQAVSTAIWEGIRVTLGLALASFIVGLIIAFPIGIFSAVRHDSAGDAVIRVVTMILAAMPSYWVAYLLILVFAVRLQLLPVIGFGSPEYAILPVATLALGSAVGLSRLIRSSMLETLGADYVRTAHAKGVRPLGVLTRHCLRNALIPVVTVMGRNLAGLLTGAVVVETVFSRPGAGRVIMDAISFRDYPVIQGFVLVSGSLCVCINLLVDISYVWINPRIRIT